MHVVGIDLSGPGSPQNTAVAVFESASESLGLHALSVGATDREILALIPGAPSIVGIDAPLSYSAGGGSRAADVRLRKAAIRAGLHPGTVMAPSAPRMVYLTLRGVALTRLLSNEHPGCRIVEVHPTAALALRGAPLEAVRTFKTSPRSRRTLLAWLQAQGLTGIGRRADDSDHAVAACSAALAAWRWSQGDAVWLHKAEPPMHPYDFAC